ncbi:hypothetical protein D3C85_1416590 [compost metagenome]
MNPDMERWITQDCAQPHGRGVDAISGQHLGVQAVGGQCQAAAGSGERIDVQQGDGVVRVTTLHRGPQNASTATEVQQVTAGQFVQVFKQQGATAIQATMAKHARQADDFQRAFGQWQLIGLRQALQ